MLTLFFTRDKLPAVRINHADPVTILSSEKYINEVIPFSHLYVTSESYLELIKQNIGTKLQTKIIPVSDTQVERIQQHSDFPVNISDYQIDTVSELHLLFKHKEEVNIIVINGIGLGYGDNFIGLAILQRMAKLLSPKKINVHLMQALNKRIAPVYRENSFDKNLNITISNNCSDLGKFMSMDAYVDLSGMLGYKEYGEMSLPRFYATAFSIENLVQHQDLHPKLHTNRHTAKELKQEIRNRFEKNKPIILFHPESSNKLKNCDKNTSKALINAFIEEGFNVVCASNFKYKKTGFSDCFDLISSVDSLKHLIQACDAVVSIGTVTYHLAAALDKPTLLLPVVKADIRTASKLSNVLVWLPKHNKDLYLDKYSHKTENDLKLAKEIWKNIQPGMVALGIKKWVKGFNAIKARQPKVAVVILHYGDKKYLHECIQSLTKVEGFDSILMNIIDLSKHKSMNTISFNNAIEKAIQEKAQYIWVLNDNTKPRANYLKRSLKRFRKDSKTAIVAGKLLDEKNKNKVLWGGSSTAFPLQKIKRGISSDIDFCKPSHQNWVPFDSVFIKSSVFSSIGFLDESIHAKFYDVDFCFRVKLKKWNIIYEPSAIATKDLSANAQITASKKDIANDTNEFYRKWTAVTKCKIVSKLEKEIIKLF